MNPGQEGQGFKRAASTISGFTLGTRPAGQGVVELDLGWSR
jgi:hypothetical protein